MKACRRQFIKDALGAVISFETVHLGGSGTNDKERLTAESAAQDRYRLADPELVPFLKTLPNVTLNKSNFMALRGITAPPALPPPAPQPYKRRIPGPPGAPDVNVMIVDPRPGKNQQPALLYIHGGGYTTGSSAMEVPFLQQAAQTGDCVVISADYRLAPEAKFPAALEDNYAALRWMHKNADSLAIDRKRIAVGGMCSGGGHAASLVIAARDRKEVPIIFQLLLQPMLDDRTGSSRPVPPFLGNFVWTAESNSFGWTSLLGVPAGSSEVPKGSVPARVEDLTGLPRTFIAVGSIDLFVDEDIGYAHRLVDSGVPTELHVFPGGYHGFFSLVPTAAISRRFNEYWTGALQRAFCCP